MISFLPKYWLPTSQHLALKESHLVNAPIDKSVNTNRSHSFCLSITKQRWPFEIIICSWTHVSSQQSQNFLPSLTKFPLHPQLTKFPLYWGGSSSQRRCSAATLSWTLLRSQWSKWSQTIPHTQKPGSRHQNQVSSYLQTKVMDTLLREVVHDLLSMVDPGFGLQRDVRLLKMVSNDFS